MNIFLSLFPVLTQDLFSKIGFLATPYEFEYNHEGIRNKLNSLPIDNHAQKYEFLQISDDKSIWLPDKHNLCFKRSYTLSNHSFLFGENGLVCDDAEIGVALIWSSKTSNQRGAINIFSFRKTENSALNFQLQSSFPQGFLKGTVNFQTIIYIKKPGVKKESENHLANQPGIILGTLDEYSIILEGNASVFPIVEVAEPAQPLWWVNCDWSDPLADSFNEENVRICLNSAHPNYRLLKIDKGIKESPILVEIIASALQVIIQKVRDSEYWNEVLNGENMEPGSVGQAVNYFISTFNWDPHSPEKLAYSIRSDFDGRI